MECVATVVRTAPPDPQVMESKATEAPSLIRGDEDTVTKCGMGWRAKTKGHPQKNS